MKTVYIVVQKTPKLNMISVSAAETYNAPKNQHKVYKNDTKHLNIKSAVKALESL